MKIRFKRSCPICKTDILYTKKINCENSKLIGKLCKSCSLKKAWSEGKYKKSKTCKGQHWKLTNETKNKMSHAQKGKKLSEETKRKISESKKGKSYIQQFGIERAEQIKEKMRLKRYGINNPNYNNGKKISGKNNPMYNTHRVGKLNPFYGKTHTNETRLKMRLSAIKRIERDKNNGNQIMPSYNKNAISILEQKAKELGITDLMHAENGGEYYIKELGYWVDGYSPNKNIVIEYYEKYHKQQKERDRQRKEEIIKLLNCEFIEINE